MAMNAWTLFGKLALDTAGFKRDLTDAQKTATKTGATIEKDLGGGAKGAAQELGKGATAAANLGKALDQKQVKDYAAATKRMSDEVRAGVRPLSDLKTQLEQQERALKATAQAQDKNSSEYRETIKELIDVRRELKSTTGELDTQTTALQRLGDGMTRLGGRLSIGITAPLTALGIVGVRSAMQLETFAASLEVLIGDAERATGVFDDLYQFSAATPFSWASLTEGTRVLAAFGTEAEQIVPTLSMLGDVAAGVQTPIEDLAEIYGRVQLTGRLGMEEVNRLAQRGIPIYTELAKQLGVTESQVRDLVTAGKVGFPQLEQAFTDLTSEGGQFFGMMEAQSRQTEGRLNTLKDSFEQVTDAIGERLLPIFSALIDAAQRATDWFTNLNEANQGILIGLGGALAATGPILLGLGSIAKLLPVIATGMNAVRVAAAFLTGPFGLIALLATATVALGFALAGRATSLDKSLAAATDALNAKDADSLATAIDGVADRLKPEDPLRARLLELQQDLKNTGEVSTQTAKEIKKAITGIMEAQNAAELAVLRAQRAAVATSLENLKGGTATMSALDIDLARLRLRAIQQEEINLTAAVVSGERSDALRDRLIALNAERETIEKNLAANQAATAGAEVTAVSTAALTKDLARLDARIALLSGTTTETTDDTDKTTTAVKDLGKGTKDLADTATAATEKVDLFAAALAKFGTGRAGLGGTSAATRGGPGTTLAALAGPAAAIARDTVIATTEAYRRGAATLDEVRTAVNALTELTPLSVREINQLTAGVFQLAVDAERATEAARRQAEQNERAPLVTPPGGWPAIARDLTSINDVIRATVTLFAEDTASEMERFKRNAQRLAADLKAAADLIARNELFTAAQARFGTGRAGLGGTSAATRGPAAAPIFEARAAILRDTVIAVSDAYRAGAATLDEVRTAVDALTTATPLSVKEINALTGSILPLAAAAEQARRQAELIAEQNERAPFDPTSMPGIPRAIDLTNAPSANVLGAPTIATQERLEELRQLEIAARQKQIDQLLKVAAGDGPLTQFGKGIANLVVKSIPLLDTAIQGFVQGGPIGAATAVFTELLGRAEAFSDIMALLDNILDPIVTMLNQLLTALMPIIQVAINLVQTAFIPLALIIENVLAPVITFVATLIANLYNAIASAINAVLGWAGVRLPLIDLSTGKNESLTTGGGLIEDLERERSDVQDRIAKSRSESEIAALNRRLEEINAEIARLRALGLTTEPPPEGKKEPEDDAGRERMNFTGTMQTIQFAVATPLVEAAAEMLQASMTIRDTFAGTSGTGAAMTSFTGALNKATPVLERLATEGIRVDLRQALSTATPDGSVGALR